MKDRFDKFVSPRQRKRWAKIAEQMKPAAELMARHIEEAAKLHVGAIYVDPTRKITMTPDQCEYRAMMAAERVVGRNKGRSK
jgi:hypothetical protein